jgi:RiboL-PSP-HEPN
MQYIKGGINSKHPEFSRALPDDRELHMLWRERIFVDAYENIVSQRVEIPDRVVDTKSNLNTIVLKRNLYQLGLDYPEVERHRHSIEMLLGARNAIAHGDVLKVPRLEEIRQWSSAAFEVMRFVQSAVFTALNSELYRRRMAEESESEAT